MYTKLVGSVEKKKLKCKNEKKLLMARILVRGIRNRVYSARELALDVEGSSASLRQGEEKEGGGRLTCLRGSWA